MKKLTREQFELAKLFLFESARPLEKHLFLHLFGGLPVDQAVVELARFCSVDGGFGQSLESDMRAAESSALATSIAMQTMRLCKLEHDHELVQHALRYLLNSIEEDSSGSGGGWRIIPDSARTGDGDRAPWWSAPPDDTNTCAMFNPSAELLGYLIEWGAIPNAKTPRRQDAKEGKTVKEGEKNKNNSSSDSSWRLGDLASWRNPQTATKARAVAAFITDHLNTHTDPLESHELLCLMRLAQTPNLPDELKAIILPRLEHDAPQVATTDPKQWGGYGLMPLWLAPTPDHPAATALGQDILNKNLDYEIDRQDPHGQWNPTWDWGPDNRAAWELAKPDWQGVLTLQTLLTLRAYDRIE